MVSQKSAHAGFGLSDLTNNELSDIYRSKIINDYGFGGMIVLIEKEVCGILNTQTGLIVTTTSTITTTTTSNGNALSESDDSLSFIFYFMHKILHD